MSDRKVRVAVNGYGVIGKRIADAVVAQDDMHLGWYRRCGHGLAYQGSSLKKGIRSLPHIGGG